MTVVMPARRRRVEGRGLPRVRRRGRPPRRPRRRVAGAPRAPARGTRPRARPPLRRPRGPARQRLVRPRDPRGPAGRRRGRDRRRRRRADRRGDGRAVASRGRRIRVYGVEPEGSDALRQAMAAGEPVRAHAAERRRRAERAVGGPATRSTSPAATSRAHVTIDDPTILDRPPVRGRADEAGPRAGGRRRPRRGPHAVRSRSATATASRSCCRAATSRRTGSASCSPRRGRSRRPPDGTGDSDPTPDPRLPDRPIDGIPDGPPAGPPLPPAPDLVPQPPRRRRYVPGPGSVRARHTAWPRLPPPCRARSSRRSSEAVLAIPLGTRELVRQSLDLLTRRDAGLRGPSFYIGLHPARDVGPLPSSIIGLTIGASVPGTARRLRAARPGAGLPLWPFWMCPGDRARICSATSRRASRRAAMATAVIGGRVEGRPLRHAPSRSRSRGGGSGRSWWPRCSSVIIAIRIAGGRRPRSS